MGADQSTNTNNDSDSLISIVQDESSNEALSGNFDMEVVDVTPKQASVSVPSSSNQIDVENAYNKGKQVSVWFLIFFLALGCNIYGI